MRTHLKKHLHGLYPAYKLLLIASITGYRRTDGWMDEHSLIESVRRDLKIDRACHFGANHKGVLFLPMKETYVIKISNVQAST